MRETLRKIMAEIFDVPLEEITDDASPDTIENWDSINHLNLILALEQSFGVQFSDQQMIEMLNFNLIIISLREVSAKEQG